MNSRCASTLHTFVVPSTLSVPRTSWPATQVAPAAPSPARRRRRSPLVDDHLLSLHIGRYARSPLGVSNQCSFLRSAAGSVMHPHDSMTGASRKDQRGACPDRHLLRLGSLPVVRGADRTLHQYHHDATHRVAPCDKPATVFLHGATMSSREQGRLLPTPALPL